MAKKRFLIWRLSAILNFWNLVLMSCDLYCHAILLPCIEFHWNQKIGCSSYGKKTIYLNGSSLPSWILKTVIFGHVTVIEFQICICVPNFIKIRFFVEICRLHYTRISAILNFMGPIIASLKSPCRTTYMLSMLSFRENSIFSMHFGDSGFIRQWPNCRVLPIWRPKATSDPW